MAGRGRGIRTSCQHRSRFRAGPYCPRPHPHLLPAGRRRAKEGDVGARTRGKERQRARADACRDASARHRGQHSSGAGLCVEPSGSSSARCAGDVAADGRVRTVRVFRDGRPRPGTRRSVRAPCTGLRRRLVVPHHAWLGTDGERRRQTRPRHDAARVRHAPGQRARRARAAARDVRGRLGRRSVRSNRAMHPARWRSPPRC